MNIAFDAASDRLAREHNDRAWMTWHIAALVRSKRMKPLKKLQAKPRRQVRPGWQQLAEIAKAWVVTSGGVIKQVAKAKAP